MESPFALATSLNDFRNVLEAGFDPNEASPGDGTTAVFHLWNIEADIDYAAVLKLLVEYGADLDHVDISGNTALFRSESDALSVSLVKAGASIFTKGIENFQTKSVLVSSAKKGHVNTVIHLVEQMGVCVDTYLGRGTVLHHLLYNHVLIDEGMIVDGLVTLVKYTDAVDARDFLGRTPLYLVYESAKCADVLLSGGADPNVKVPRGWWYHRHVFDTFTSGELNAAFADGPLMQGSWERAIHGVHYRCPEVIRLLLERGADVDSVDSDGNTALHRLFSEGPLTRHAFEVFNVLFLNGASCTMRNAEGETVADMPLSRHPLVVRKIRDRAREENWSRRRGLFLALSKCTGVASDEEWETECGVIRLLAHRGYMASQGFMRNVVEYM
jgi:ankyrin repeat protein